MIKFKDKEAREEIHELKYNFDGITSCEKCKCLIKKADAIKGKSIIKTRIKPLTFYYSEEEHTHTPYYCHKCKKVKRK